MGELFLRHAGARGKMLRTTLTSGDETGDWGTVKEA